MELTVLKSHVYRNNDFSVLVLSGRCKTQAQTHNQEPIRYANIVKLQYCIHTSNGKVGT